MRSAYLGLVLGAVAVTASPLRPRPQPVDTSTEVAQEHEYPEYAHDVDSPLFKQWLAELEERLRPALAPAPAPAPTRAPYLKRDDVETGDFEAGVEDDGDDEEFDVGLPGDDQEFDVGTPGGDGKRKKPKKPKQPTCKKPKRPRVTKTRTKTRVVTHTDYVTATLPIVPIPTLPIPLPTLPIPIPTSTYFRPSQQSPAPSLLFQDHLWRLPFGHLEETPTAPANFRS